MELKLHVLKTVILEVWKVCYPKNLLPVSVDIKPKTYPSKDIRFLVHREQPLQYYQTYQLMKI
jgi:hypothetical protein